MEDWHWKIARHLVACTPLVAADEHSTALEVAFGRARATVAYVLELARAHRIPAAGGVTGDDVWLQIEDQRARFTLNRREGTIVVRTDQHERHMRWDAAGRVIVDVLGTPVNVEHIARATVEEVVDQWRKTPAAECRSSVPPQPDLERDDQPTKGWPRAKG